MLRAKSGLSRSGKVVSDLLDFAKAGAQPDGTTTPASEVLDSLSQELQSRLAAAHGGAVGVGSELGRGCTFWFELPGTPMASRETADLARTAPTLH